MMSAEIKTKVSIEHLIQHYGGSLNGKHVGRCLFPDRHQHGDAHPSMSVRDGRVYCWAQQCFGEKGADIFELVGRMEGLSQFPDQKRRVLEIARLNGQAAKPARREIAVYHYTDASGTLLHQTVRYEPKEFKQRRPNGQGGWIWNLAEITPVLFHLPAVVQADTILLVEGEKDVLTAERLGLPDGWAATCNPMGAGKWRDNYSETLRGKQVIILPDADDVGRRHADTVQQALSGVACHVRRLELPAGVKDLTDWAEAGGSRAGFHALLETATDVPAAAGPPAAHPFALTDSGNAEYFAQRYGALVRYDHARARWLLWRQHRWHPDVDAEIRRLAKAAVRRRLDDAAQTEHADERARLAKWALSSESHPRLNALLTLAQAERPIADTGDTWDPDPYLLGVPNGVIDLSTGQLRAGRHEDRITLNVAVPFDPEATCPRWERFMAEVFAGNQDLVAFLQRAIGYSLTGRTGEQCLFLCYGTGANGKGTLLGTLEWLLHDYAYNMPFSTIELQQRAAIPNDLAALVGRRFVAASETNDGTRLNESRIKALTGCDTVTARFLHGEFFTFQPVAKFWLSVNHRPIVRDDSVGFWRRIRLIPFSQQFPLNPTLADDLRTEGLGILAWAVRGCLKWLEADGLQPPDVVLQATKDYEHESDPLSDFIEEKCELGDAHSIKAADLFDGYKQWAEEQKLSERERLNRTSFGRKAGTRFDYVKTRDGKVYKGVHLRIL